MTFEEPKVVKSSGKHPCVEWGGKRWYLTQKYYIDRQGKLLHRAIYEHVYGEIPEDFHVHHKNEDKSDNSIDNLEALSVSDHIKSHELRGFAAEDFDKAIGARVMWEQRKPQPYNCVECGGHFESTCTRARFCKPFCARQFYYYNKRGKRQ